MPTVPQRLPSRWEIGIAIGLYWYGTLIPPPSRWPVLVGCLAILAATRIDSRRYRWIATAVACAAPALWLYAQSDAANAKEALLIVTVFFGLLNGVRSALAPAEVQTPFSYRLSDIVFWAAMAEWSGGRREMWIGCGAMALITVTQILVTHFRKKPEAVNAQ